MIQEIKYSRILTKHITLVRDELTHLQIEFDPSFKVRKLVGKLREHYKTKQINEFTNLHGHPPRESDLDLLHFKPTHAAVLEWGDAYCQS